MTMAKPQPDTAEIRKALDILCGPAVVEIRALHKRKKRTDAGYYDENHREDLVTAAVKLNKEDAAVYITLNPVDPQLLGRYNNRVEQFAKDTATDANVTRRHWLLIDVDPIRPKNTASTDKQLDQAKDTAREIFNHLKGCGWPTPVVAESGNGMHLLYRVDLINDNESRDLIKGSLAALASRFDNDAVTVDRSVFNAARIIKLYGTVATKGDHTGSAPWRLSKITAIPEDLLIVSVDQLRALAPVQSPMVLSARQVTGSAFCLEAFLVRQGIPYQQDQHNGRDRFKLDSCPFNQDHGKGDAAIFRDANGVFAFKCFHNECADKTWRDVRELVDGPAGNRRASAPDCLPPSFSFSDNSDNSDLSDRFRQIPMHSETFRQGSESYVKTRSLSKEVLAFIESEPAPFTSNDVYSELCARTKEEKKSICDALRYYKKLGKINSIEGKRGCWEVREDSPEIMDLMAADTTPFNILLPLNISEHCRVMPGSVVLVSGSSNAGKTLFLLAICRNFFAPHIDTQNALHLSNERLDVARITYLNSEMSPGELVTRIKRFGDEPASWVPHVKFIARTHSFDKLVDPDGVTFIDFLEVNEDFFNAGKFIADIHRRLKDGVAVVAMQKKQGHAFAKGGEMTLEKPRLVINLDKNGSHGFTCKIAKCKEPADFMHTIQGMERDFVISGRSEILPISDWRFVNESQRKQINQEYARTGLPDRVKQDRIDYRTGEPLFMAPSIYAEEGAL